MLLIPVILYHFLYQASKYFNLVWTVSQSFPGLLTYYTWLTEYSVLVRSTTPHINHDAIFETFDTALFSTFLYVCFKIVYIIFFLVLPLEEISILWMSDKLNYIFK
jgi:hypothetical protein